MIFHRQVSSTPVKKAQIKQKYQTISKENWPKINEEREKKSLVFFSNEKTKRQLKG